MKKRLADQDNQNRSYVDKINYFGRENDDLKRRLADITGDHETKIRSYSEQITTIHR